MNSFRNKAFATFCACILLWPSETMSLEPPKNSFHVSDSMDLTDPQRQVAQQIEKEMRDYDFSDELIAGAIINAYAESKLDPMAIGSEMERGVFQLHPSGLGKGMSPDEMHDVRHSVDRIARAIKRNRKMLRLQVQNASIEEQVKSFCIEIERPSNSYEKALGRVRLMKKIVD